MPSQTGLGAEHRLASSGLVAHVGDRQLGGLSAGWVLQHAGTGCRPECQTGAGGATTLLSAVWGLHLTDRLLSRVGDV